MKGGVGTTLQGQLLQKRCHPPVHFQPVLTTYPAGASGSVHHLPRMGLWARAHHLPSRGFGQCPQTTQHGLRAVPTTYKHGAPGSAHHLPRGSPRPLPGAGSAPPGLSWGRRRSRGPVHPPRTHCPAPCAPGVALPVPCRTSAGGGQADADLATQPRRSARVSPTPGKPGRWGLQHHRDREASLGSAAAPCTRGCTERLGGVHMRDRAPEAASQGHPLCPRASPRTTFPKGQRAAPETATEMLVPDLTVN